MIRKCNLSDKESWCRLNQEFMRYEYKEENLWEDPLKKGDPEEIFELMVRKSNSPNLLFLIEEENRPIGFLNTVSFTSVWAHGEVLFIDDFFITERYRGKGYGKKALEELENKMKQEGFKRIQLMAEDTNPGAVSFYEKEEYLKQRIHFFCKYI